jgi:hypothetical protein
MIYHIFPERFAIGRPLDMQTKTRELGRGAHRREVDPMFGDEGVLGDLIDELHKRGMQLIMDAVLNHVGTEHPWFQAAKRVMCHTVTSSLS